MTNKEHRFFHYDLDTGKSTPVEPVRVGNVEFLVPVQIKEDSDDENDTDRNDSGEADQQRRDS
jgi:hypothetical protein